WKETRQLLEDGLDLLPPQQQRVYRLCHQQGLKYEEVACLLDIAPGTVQSHMKLALRFLRNYLKQHIDTGILSVTNNYMRVDAVHMMKVGPSVSGCRFRYQTTAKLLGLNVPVVSVGGKGLAVRR